MKISYSLIGTFLLLQLTAGVAAAAPITAPITAPVSQPTSGGNSEVLQPEPPHYNTQAPVCGDNKPTSAPRIISALSNEANKVIIHWTQANDPVTYYLVSYGTKPGKAEYGNPNIGGKDARSYIVSGLSGGQTYYFRIKAGNGCTPGEFSNEVAVRVSGINISKPATGFNGKVLSTSKKEVVKKFQPITAYTPTRPATTISDFKKTFGQIFAFFGKMIH